MGLRDVGGSAPIVSNLIQGMLRRGHHPMVKIT
jgi:hypothetical protein